VENWVRRKLGAWKNGAWKTWCVEKWCVKNLPEPCVKNTVGLHQRVREKKVVREKIK